MKKKRFLPILLAVTMIISCLPGEIRKKAGIIGEVKAEEVTLRNPRIASDKSMDAGQKVTWDCVWFGSYPQTEIVDIPETCGTYGMSWGHDYDYVVDSRLYARLLNESEWDYKGITTIDNVQYKRIKRTDAIYSITPSWAAKANGYYCWEDDVEYHYFRCDKIKWRVLKADNNQALLLADQALSNQQYIDSNSAQGDWNGSITWKNSSIRSWLNGYGKSSNGYSIDYSQSGFIRNAFSENEIAYIKETQLDNANTSPYDTDSESTIDRIFLLAAYDVYQSDDSSAYGFIKDATVSNLPELAYVDEGRCCMCTTYARAMGVWGQEYYPDYCIWMLRSLQNSTNYLGVGTGGNVNLTESVKGSGDAIRPALILDTKNSDAWSYAGIVRSDGTVNEQGEGDDTSVKEKEQTITASRNSYTFTFNPAKVQSQEISVTGAMGTLSYTSINSKYVSVKDGKITVAKGTPAGTYKITVKAEGTSDGEYKPSNTITVIVKIIKAANTIKVNPASKKYKVAKVKKKAQSFTIKFTQTQGKVTFKSNNKKVKVTSKGKVTVKKGTKKGKYKITVTAAGNGNYNKGVKTVVITVK